MTNKQRYLDICKTENLPLFMQGWWLDITCKNKGGWDCLIVDYENETVGAIAYYCGKRFGFRFIIMPQLTQTGGVWMHDKVKDDEKLGYYIISKIEQHFKEKKLSLYYQQFDEKLFSYKFFNANSYSLKKRVTYRIENTDNLKAIRNGFHKNKIRQLRKSERNLIEISTNCSAEDFYFFRKKCLLQKGQSIFYTKDYFLRLYSETKKRNQSQIIVAKNADGLILAAVFLVWDNNVCYYLIPSYDTKYSKLGGMAAVTYKAIVLSSLHSKVFDFEGSLEPSIALSYKQFGGQPCYYYSVQRFFNPIFKWGLKLKNLQQHLFK